MKYSHRLIIAGLIAAATLSFTTEARADGPWQKLQRGVINLFTAVVELPATMCEMTRHEGPAEGLTLGFFSGLGNMAARQMIGVYETVAFAAPWPDHYQPYLQPTYAWDRFKSQKEPSPVPPPPVIPAAVPQPQPPAPPPVR